MTHPERQRDPFDTQEEAERSVDRLFARADARAAPTQRSFKNLEALERRLGEIERRLAGLEQLSAATEIRFSVASGQMSAAEANAKLFALYGVEVK